ERVATRESGEIDAQDAWVVGGACLLHMSGTTALLLDPSADLIVIDGCFRGCHGALRWTGSHIDNARFAQRIHDFWQRRILVDPYAECPWCVASFRRATLERRTP